MNRMKDYIRTLHQYQGARYDNSYIGRLSYAHWGEDTEETRFTVKAVRNGSNVECLRVQAWNDKLCIGLLEAWIFFSKFKRTHHKTTLSKELPSGPCWKIFRREEIIDFAEKTGDLNPIHLTERPVVQGLLILDTFYETCHHPDLLSINFLMPIHADEPVYLEEEVFNDRTKLFASSCSRSFHRCIAGKKDDSDCRLCRAVSGLGVHFFSAAFHAGHGDGPDHHGELRCLHHGT
jgi:hypothetical protein